MSKSHHNRAHHNDFQLPDFRSDIDGTGNNLQNPDFNSRESDFIRIGDAHFLNNDGHTPILDDLPNPRDISNIVVAGGPDPEGGNPEGLSDLMYVFGQFIDHDTDLMNQDPNQPLNVTVPPGDPSLDPGITTIPVSRVITDPDTGTADHPAIAINNITGWLDGSQIYGSDAATASMLRDAGGKLKVSPGDNLPIGSGDMFLAGDVRVQENPNLTAMHTLFVREHNFQVDQLAQAHPELSDEQLYQTAKAITTAEYQNIIYNEYLPHLLGPDAIPDYQGYDPNVDPRITEEFAGAAFRFGHSIVSPEENNINEFGVTINSQDLQESFFEPASVFLAGGGADPAGGLLRSIASEQAPPLDSHIVDALRNFLSDPPDAIDLASTNIQRAHDLGIGTLNETRSALGLTPYTSFDQITSDITTQQALATAFGNDINKVDLWTGGLSENHATDAFVGETFQKVIGDQFTALRDGDRFFFENQNFDAKTLSAIKETTLSDLIARDTNTDHIQADAFVATERVSGQNGPNPGPTDSDEPLLVIGSQGVDTLLGGPEDDTLVAGIGGKQTLTGGDGADTFIIPNGAKAKISDFEKGVDTIQREHAIKSKWDGGDYHKVAADKVAAAAELVSNKNDIAGEKVGAAAEKVAAKETAKAEKGGDNYYHKGAEKDGGDYYHKGEKGGGGDDYYKDYGDHYNHHNYDSGEHHANYAHHDYWG